MNTDYFLDTNLPDDASIVDVIAHIRGLQFFSRWPAHLHPEEARLFCDRPGIIARFRKYREILIQFKDRFRSHKGYQRALNYLCYHIPFMVPEEGPTYEWMKTLRSKEVTRRRWSILHASARLLGLQSRAVVTANHPSRKRSRNEFEASSDDDCT